MQGGLWNSNYQLSLQAGIGLNLSVMTIGATIGITYAVERMSRSKGGKGGRIITTASVAGLVVSLETYLSGNILVKSSFAEISTSRQQLKYWGLLNCKIWKCGAYTIIPTFEATSFRRGSEGFCALSLVYSYQVGH